jgi:hypothetical protein
MLKRLAKDKHSSLLDPVVGYEENEVLQIWALLITNFLSKIILISKMPHSFK